MKRTLAVLCVALFLLTGCACRNGNLASPSPNLTVKPTTSPMVGATTTLPLSPLPSAPLSPGTTGGGTIEGFVEGQTVEVSALPSEITAAVGQAYPGATISTAVYETYMGAQAYLLTLTGAADKTDKIYVMADGSIVPYATPAAS